MAVPVNTTIQTQIANLYIAILGRNPEPAGFAYWTDNLANNNGTAQALQNITLAFSNAPEFVATYGGQTTEAAVGLMYTNVLNRTADTGGLNYWVGIANGYIAQGYTIAQAYALTGNAIATGAAANTGTADAALMATKQAAAIASGTAAPTTTYTLTTGIDNIVTTTSGDNTVVGAVTGSATTTTLNAGDSINGTVGNTTLSISASGDGGEISGVTLTGVKTVQVSNNTTLGGSFDLTGATGLVTLATNNSGAARTEFTNIGNTVAASLTNTRGDFGINYVDSVVSGTADAMSVALNGVATSTQNVVFDVDGIETLNVTSNGTASGSSTNGTRVTLDSTTLKTMNISGSAGARITADFGTSADGSTNLKVATVNASTATGAIDVLLTTGTSTTSNIGQYVSVTGGSGNDTVQINALSTNATIAGGTGTDTLAVNTLAGGSNDFKNISGFEAIRFNSAVSDPVNLTNAGTISSVVFNSTVNSTLTGVNTGVSAQLNSQTVASENTGRTLTLNVVGASASETDTATIILGNTTADIAASLNRGTVQVESVETINLQSLSKTFKSDFTNSVAIQDTGIKALNVTGNQSASVTIAAGSNSLETVDASAFTGNFNMTGISNDALSDTAANVIGGSGNDTLKGGAGDDSILGNAGNDSISAGEGNDTVDGGAGNDIINAGTGYDSLMGGTGNDIFRFNDVDTLTSNDTVVGGDGTDRIEIGANATLVDTAFKNISAVETVTVQTTGENLTLTIGTNFGASGIANINQFVATGATNPSGTGNTAVTASSTFTGAVTINSAAGVDSISFAGTTGSFTYTNAAGNVTSTDTISGGSSLNDAITLRADNGSADFTNVSGVETVTISASSTAPESTVGLTIGANTVTNGNAMTVNASSLVDVGASLNFDASASTTTGTLAARFNVTGGNANDTIRGGGGNDTVTSGLGNDYIVAGEGNNSVVAGSGNDTIYAGSGNDVLHGDSGNDFLQSGGGADTVTGGTGNDTYSYLVAADSLVVDNVNGTQSKLDTIVGFNAGSGTSTTVVDRIASSTQVNAIGTVTIGTASLTTLATALGANATLANASQGDAFVITISGGTAAGTYLTIVGAVSGGFSAATDTVVKLSDATNLENLILQNFTTTGVASLLSAIYDTAAAVNSYTISGTAQGAVVVALDGAVTDAGAPVTDVTGTFSQSGVKIIDLSGITNAGTAEIQLNATNSALTTLKGLLSGTTTVALSGSLDLSGDTITDVDVLTISGGTTATVAQSQLGSGKIATVTGASSGTQVLKSSGLTLDVTGVTLSEVETLATTDASTDNEAFTVAGSQIGTGKVTTLAFASADGTETITFTGNSLNFTGVAVTEAGSGAEADIVSSATSGDVTVTDNASTAVISGKTVTITSNTTGLLTIASSDSLNLSALTTTSTTGKFAVSISGASKTATVVSGDLTGANGGISAITMGATAGTVTTASSSGLDLNVSAVTLTNVTKIATATTGSNIITVAGNQLGTGKITAIDFADDAGTDKLLSTGSLDLTGVTLNYAANEVGSTAASGSVIITDSASGVAGSPATAAISGRTITVSGQAAADVTLVSAGALDLTAATLSNIDTVRLSEAATMTLSNLSDTAALYEGSSGADTFYFNTSTAIIDANVTVNGLAGSDTFALDATGAQAVYVSMSSFAAGTGGDKIGLNGNGTSDSSDLITARVLLDIQSTGVAVVGDDTLAASVTGLVALSGSSFQINGALTSTGSGGAVATALLAAALTDVTTNAYFYAALDNGTDTGIYRVKAATVSGALNEVAEVSEIILVGIANGVTNSGSLTSANFVTAAS